ncbi:MAG: hypothetical protein WCH62_05195 [Candidatus Omnitrophota bacterium]
MYIQELKRQRKAKKRQKVVNLVLVVVNLALYAFMAVILSHPTDLSDNVIRPHKAPNIKPHVRLIKLTTKNPEQEVKVREIADQMGYKNTEYLIKLLNCESNLHPEWTNNKKNYPKGSRDRGIAQINSYWQKQVPDSCAYDLTCAVKWTIKKLEAGQNVWACRNYIK